jgi:hypothetical protein
MALLSLQDVATASGLTAAFIRRLLKRLPEYLAQYQKRGANNSIQIEPNALGIFQHIGQLKAEGFTIPQIKSELAAGGLGQGAKVVKPGYQTLPNPGKPSADADDRVGELMAELRRAERELHQERLERLRMEADFGKMKTLLLPEGKTPEQVAQEQRKAEKRRAAMHARRLELLARLDGLPFWRWRARGRLLSDLRRLEQEGTGERGTAVKKEKSPSVLQVHISSKDELDQALAAWKENFGE